MGPLQDGLFCAKQNNADPALMARGKQVLAALEQAGAVAALQAAIATHDFMSMSGLVSKADSLGVENEAVTQAKEMLAKLVSVDVTASFEDGSNCGAPFGAMAWADNPQYRLSFAGDKPQTFWITMCELEDSLDFYGFHVCRNTAAFADCPTPMAPVRGELLPLLAV